MHLALLGADSQTLSLAKAATAAGHRLRWAYDAGELAGPLKSLAPQITFAQEWESLLLEGFAEAVIVARGDHEERADQLRKLAAVGVPMLVSHPVHSSVLLHFELEMLRRDVNGVILPFVVSRWHPAASRLEEMLDFGELGRLEQIVLERTLPERARADVLAQFAVDADLLRRLAGDLTRLGAMGATGGSGYENLGVQLFGPSGVLVRWSAESGFGKSGGRLVVTGSEGRAVLTMPDDTLTWALETAGTNDNQAGENQSAEKQSLQGQSVSSTSVDGADSPRLAIESLAEAIRGQPPPLEWNDAARAVELAETIDRSLKRGRVIELNLEERSEESEFKGAMASLGCGLLLLGLFILVLSTAAGNLGARWADYWPLALLLVLGLFLLLQCLRFVLPAGKNDG
jgi:predicted dehydrogenase